MLFAAQEQALRTDAIKAKIDKQPVSPKCTLCWKKEDTVMHLVAPSLRRINAEEDMTMLPEGYIGSCARKLRQVV